MEDAELRALPVDEVVERVGVARAIPIKHVASLLFTYRCTIACAHCLFSCGPRQPDRCVSRDDGVAFLRQLRATDRVVHIAGGEAMMYWDEMLAVCRDAAACGAAPHFIETNASFAKEDALTRDRYEALREVGVRGILISADAFHQRFVPATRRLRAYRIAVEVFGRENVAAGDHTLAELRRLRAIGRDPERLAEYARSYAPRLVGRAGEELARHFPPRPREELARDGMWHGGGSEESCRLELDPATMWEIHVDPYGNIQTCCGIVVGNVHDSPLPEAMARGFHTDNELVRLAYERGPWGYLELAEARGYRPPAEGFVQKCHLCWETRKFLRRWHPETFGPAEVYGGVTGNGLLDRARTRTASRPTLNRNLNRNLNRRPADSCSYSYSLAGRPSP